MKESYEGQITFPKINSSIMEIVLEYVYTGSIKEESLNRDEVFYAADYFRLPDFQKCTVFKEKDYTENYTSELLPKVVETSEDSSLIDALIAAIAIIPLNTIEFSIVGLQYLLSYTCEKEESFATPEYEVFSI